jgi:hypothetical protein
MKSWVFKTLILVGILVGIIALLVTSFGPTVGYWRFLVRSKAYYVQVAKACDTLLAKHARDMPSLLSKLDRFWFSEG